MNAMKQLFDFQKQIMTQNLIDSIISSSKKNDHNIPVIYPMFMSKAVDDFYFKLNKNYTDTFKHNYITLLSLL